MNTTHTQRLYLLGEKLKSDSKSRFYTSYQYFNGADESVRLYADNLMSEDPFKNKISTRYDVSSEEFLEDRRINSEPVRDGDQDLDGVVKVLLGLAIIGASSNAIGILVQSSFVQELGMIMLVYAGSVSCLFGIVYSAMVIGHYAIPAAMYGAAFSIQAIESVFRYVDYTVSNVVGNGLQTCAEMIEGEDLTPLLNCQ